MKKSQTADQTKDQDLSPTDPKAVALLKILAALESIAPPIVDEQHDGDTILAVLKSAAAYYGRHL